jgi:AraC-like DNA-binding protein
MIRIKFKYMLKNKQTRLILLLTLCVSLLITLIGLGSYVRYREGLDTELNAPNVELLQINMDVTNRAFREADEKAVDLSYRPEILSYMNAGSSGQRTGAGGVQQLLAGAAADKKVQSVAVADFAHKSVVSSDFGYKVNWEEAPDASWTAWIQEIEKRPLLIKRRWLDSETGDSSTELLSIVRPVMADGKATGAVIVNLDYDLFFSQMYTHLSSQQYVYNLDGELIYPKLNTGVQPSDMDAVIDELDVSPFGYVKVQGQEYMANQTFSDVTGWRLVSLVPMDHMLKNVKLARNMMLFLSFVSIIVGCSAIYYYNYAAFRPLRRIHQLLNPASSGSSQGSLYDLEPVIGKWVGEFQRRTFVAERSLPELRSKYIQDILNRCIGIKEVRTKWSHYFHDWSQGPLTVMVVSIDRYWQWAASFMEEDRMLLKYALQNIMEEVLAPSWRTVCVTAKKDSFAVLLQPKDEAAGAGELRLDAERLIEIVSRHLNISVSAGIGPEMQDVSALEQSYAAARKILAYRLYEGYGRVREHAAWNKHMKADIEEAWSAEIIQGLQNGDSDANAAAVAKWAILIREHGVEPEQVYRAADHILEEILDITAARSMDPPEEINNYNWSQVQTMDLTDIEQMLCQVTAKIAEQFEVHSHTREYKRVQDMIQYMEEHMQENIGLQDIAGHVGMSVSSVSSMFKEETGTTVYDYLTHLRIAKACELLTESNHKIASIASMVGYQNENSFIRVFRKIKAVTPGKFRESSKSSSRYADLPKPRRSGIFEDT